MISERMASGMPICSNVRNWLGIRRSTMPIVAALLEDGDAEPDAVAELDGEVAPRPSPAAPAGSGRA